MRYLSGMAKTKPRKRIAVTLNVRPEMMTEIREIVATATERGTLGTPNIGSVFRRAAQLGMDAVRREAEGAGT